MVLPRRGLLYTAFFLSGITALIYEIVWARYLTLFLGGTSVANTIVLATFMGGLACGNAFFGRSADRPETSQLRLYSLLELGIGLLCLLFPTLFAQISSLYIALGSRVGAGAPLNDVLKVLLAVLSMFLPCALMGGTLPVLARYVVVSLQDLGSRIGLLYFINTAGAAVGSALGGFWVVEHWGLEFGMVGTSLVNITLGAIFYAISKGEPRDLPPAPAGAETAPSGQDSYNARQTRVALVAIGVGGGLSMLYELCWVRVLVLSMGNTVHSFSTMLLSFILGIAIGSALVGRLLRRPRNALALFALCEIGISLLVLAPLPDYEALPFIFFRLGSLLVHTPSTYPLFLLLQVLVGSALMILPTILIGATLPLASRICTDRLESVGRRVGDVFAANTVGTVLGAVLTGFVALPVLGVERSLMVGAALSGLLGVVLLGTWRPSGPDRPLPALREAWRPESLDVGPRLWPTALGLVALATASVALRPAWDPRLLQPGLYRWEVGHPFKSWDEFKADARKDTYLFSKDGADATVSVIETATGRGLLVNGKPDASTYFPDILTQTLVAHLPMFLHRDPHSAMVVGLGSGATASAILLHPGSTVDVAEISPEVVSAAAYFSSLNGGILHDPRMSLKIVDGREFLLLSPRRYDVIVSEPTNLWVPGVSALFTRDFYSVVDKRLAEGGIFSQWLHVYVSDADMVTSVASSLSEVFPYVSAWMIGDLDVIFVASRERPDFRPDVFVDRFQKTAPWRHVPATDSRARILQEPLLFLAGQVASGEAVRAWCSPARGGVYRDFRPRLEFQAARAQFLAHHYPFLENLDERVVRLAAEPLFLEAFLERYPLDSPGQARLFGALQSFGGTYQQLGNRIALAALLRGDQSLLLRLPPEEAGRALLLDRLAGQLDRGPAPDLCSDYLRILGKVLPEATSVFARPPWEKAAERVEACAAVAGADAAIFRADLAAILAASEVKGALDRIRSLAQDGSLTRLDPERRQRLLLGAAALEFQEGRREQALSWVAEALKENPSSAAAHRLERGLAPPPPGTSP
jgi:spermidine synthase